MKKILLFLTLFVISASADRVKSHTVRVHDHPRHYDRSVRGGGYHNDPILSTFDATTQVSSVIFIAATSEATTYGGAPHHDRYSLNFVEENRIEITQDIARADGEHLKTLLTMIHLKDDRESLLRIQSHFETLSMLDAEAFLTKLEEIQHT